MRSKVCRDCGETLPLNRENWNKRTNGHGWRQPCRACHARRPTALAWRASASGAQDLGRDLQEPVILAADTLIANDQRVAPDARDLLLQSG